ncbi:orotidine 5'-phosphate decarboxylase [Gluconobacter oxydans]|nr:orotidine 5'-phosphate decarboxylase [Gluconobacter oxydans]
MHWGDFVQSKVLSLSPLVMGIDPDPDHAPLEIGRDPQTFLDRYISALLDGAADKIAFVKFQSAYFEAWGSDGISSLARGIASARERGLAVILDAKRGDIGSTAEAYARAYLEPKRSDLEVDCLTINPFLGPETMEPFMRRAQDFGKGIFVLVKTSNTGSGWLQDAEVDGEPVSHRVAAFVSYWAEKTLGSSGVSSVGAVVGATYPEQGQRLRQAMPSSIFLAPGLGVQGADPTAISALATSNAPVLISASRGVAAIEDRRISMQSYIQLIGERLESFKTSLEGKHNKHI